MKKVLVGILVVVMALAVVLVLKDHNARSAGGGGGSSGATLVATANGDGGSTVRVVSNGPRIMPSRAPRATKVPWPSQMPKGEVPDAPPPPEPGEPAQAEPGYDQHVNAPTWRYLEPAAERAWISSNYEWAGRNAFEVAMGQSYYYSDEAQGFVVVRVNTHNMVVNGTFERDLFRRGFPDGWNKSYWKAARRFHEKKGDATSICLRLGRGEHWVAQSVGVEAGKKYVVSFRGKGAGSLTVTDDAGGSGTVAIKGGNWTDYSINFTAAGKTATLKFDTNDLAYIGHVRMYPADGDAAPAWPYSAKDIAKMKVRVTLLNTWGGGREVVNTTEHRVAPDATLTHTIDLSKLTSTAVGRAYAVSVDLLDGSGSPVNNVEGRPIASQVTFGFIDPPNQVLEPIKKLEWDDTYRCFVNGKPFFPLMMYNWWTNSKDEFEIDMVEMRKMGFNTIYLADHMLDKVRTMNMYALLGRPAGYIENPGPKQGDIKTLRKAREEYHDLLLAYADGVEHADNEIPWLQEQYPRDKQVDPDRPIIQCVQGVDPGRIGRYPKVAEILWIEPHTHESEAVSMLSKHAIEVGQADPARNGKAGAWIELALYSPYGPPGVGSFDVRKRAYAALCNGVSGMDWFAHHTYETDGLGRPGGRMSDINPTSWSELRGILAEIIYLTPALCAPDREGFTVGPDMVDAICREADGKIYVIANASYWYFKGALAKPYKAWDASQWQKWDWHEGPEGRAAHKSEVGNGGHDARWYWFGKIYSFKPGDKIVQEVYVEPGSKLDSIVLNPASHAVGGDYYEIRGMTRWIPWNAFQVFSSDESFGKIQQNPMVPQHHAGPMPEPGKWVDLEMDPAKMDMVGPGCIYTYQGIRWMINGQAGAKSAVWFGKTWIVRKDGQRIEVYGPTPGNQVTFTVKGLKPTSKVLSLLDGRVLPVEGETFKDQLFTNNESGAWAWGFGPRVYEITP